MSDTGQRSNVKRERFVRIAERRVNQILEALSKLENCSNAHNYEYYDDDVRKIFAEIEKRLKEVRSSFADKMKDREPFRLDT